MIDKTILHDKIMGKSGKGGNPACAGQAPSRRPANLDK